MEERKASQGNSQHRPGLGQNESLNFQIKNIRTMLDDADLILNINKNISRSPIEFNNIRLGL